MLIDRDIGPAKSGRPDRDQVWGQEQAMLFTGRDAEMAALLERWRMASDVDNPWTQVVILKAERGVGKTRLALEFFKGLAGQPGRETRYWPRDIPGDTPRLDVNPDPVACDYEAPIPFLWWGIRAADPGRRNAIAGNAVPTYEPFLAPHLVALMVRTRMLRTGRAVLDVWREIAGGELKSWTGYDSVMALGEGLLKTVSLVRGAMPGERTRAAEDALRQRRLDRNEVVLGDLEAVFRPDAMGYARAPGVILIDDAQFMGADPGLSEFTERLLRLAVAQNWPVLILITHWRRELELDEDPTSFARILARARGAERERGFLHSTNFLELDLAPLADLAPPLAEAFPGLRPAQAATLLAHAGGNPRHLEQIIAFLRENEDFFEDFDLSGPLTEAGLAEALEETQDVFKVVLRRLRDAPEEVQEAICIASLQGTRFVSGVVEAVIATHLGRAPGDNLAKAANPYSMIRRDGAGEIAAFSERLFHMVAERRRRSLKSLADEDALQAALRAALEARLEDPAFHDGDVQAQALTYGLLARILGAPQDRARRQDCLARLAYLESGRDAFAAALAAARAYAEGFSPETMPDNPADQRAVAGVAALLTEAGEAARAEAILTALHARQEAAPDRSETGITARYMVLHTLADCADMAGDGARALALEQMAAVVAAEGAGAMLLPLFARSSLALRHWQAGNLAAAKAGYGIATEEVRTVLAAGREDPATLRKLQVYLGGLLHFQAELAWEERDAPTAAALHGEGHDLIRRHLREDQSAGPEMLILSHHRMAVHARQAGDLAAATRHGAEAVALARRARDRAPSPAARQALQTALMARGNADLAAGDSRAAAAAFAEALDLARQGDAETPGPQTVDDRARAARMLGQNRLDGGDWAGARTALAEAVEAARELAAWMPSAEVQGQLAGSVGRLGRAEAQMGTPGAAALLDEAVALHKASGSPRTDLAQAQMWLAEEARQGGRTALAAAAYFEVIATLSAELAETGNPALCKSVDHALKHLAGIRAADGDADGALAALRDRVAAAELWAEATPGAAAELSLSEALDLLGRELVDAAPLEAIDHFERAESLVRAHWSDPPDGPQLHRAATLAAFAAFTAGKAGLWDRHAAARARAEALASRLSEARQAKLEVALEEIRAQPGGGAAG